MPKYDWDEHVWNHPDPPFDWSEVADRKNRILRSNFGPKPAREPISCPKCGKQMKWIKFSNSLYCWQHLCGVAGWLEVCRPCKKWGKFELRMMS